MKFQSAILMSGALMAGMALAGCGGSQSPKEISFYFDYTQEDIRSVRGLMPKNRMKAADLYDWDQRAFDLVSNKKIGDPHASRIYAYLATAQADAAALSWKATGRPAGDLGPISRDILRLFFPQDGPSSPVRTDHYSENLAAIVMAKVKARIVEDERAAKLYPEKTGSGFWKGIKPYYAQDVGSWKRWNVASLAEFMAPLPPADDSLEMKEQLKRVKEARSGVSEHQRRAVILWAGGPGTKTPPGQWLEITDESLRSREAPLEKALVVRAALTRTIADAVIVVFHNKYTYWKRRPFMLDASIQTIMPTPNHPSYPAGHGTISGAASTMLAHYIPEDGKGFLAKGGEANNSRLWGGIHFPQDNDEGFLLGKKVARKTLGGSR